MSETEFLVSPRPPPDLRVPPSSSTVKVYVIDTTTRLACSVAKMVGPQIGVHRSWRGPSFSFLIVHGDRRLLFDLGVRKDTEKLPPAIQKRLETWPFELSVDKDVAELLDEHAAETGVTRNDIEAVIWSHHHWDHTGRVDLFPSSTELLLGPGLQKQYLPGYPTNPEATINEENLSGRNVREVDFASDGSGKNTIKIGNFEAVDFFDDGSFYLLSTPGHTVGHLCGLARTTSDPPSFILMGGDACHHCGEIRPSPYLPLPKTITPSPLSKFRHSGCPGAMFEQLQPSKRADKAFYDPRQGFNADHELSMQTLRDLEEFDAADSVLTILAHDESVLGELDLFPKPINDWRAKDVGKKTRWAFLSDFVSDDGGDDTK